MDSDKLKVQVETIRQAFGYINKFKNHTFVVKIESALLKSKQLPLLMKDIVLLHKMGIRIVLVPGARELIDNILDKFSIKYSSVNGIRITSPEAIQFTKMGAFDAANQLMTLLAENKTSAIIGNWVKARSFGIIEGVDYMNTGTVDTIDSEKLQMTLDAGIIPIFPNIGWNQNGKPYNISSNELALSISQKLQASKLFFLTAEKTVNSKKYNIPENSVISNDNTISQLTLYEAKKFLKINPIDHNDEILEIVAMGQEACSHGIKRVHILDGEIEGILLKEIFSNRGLGTMIYSNQLENFRKMAHNDIPTVLSIMSPDIKNGILLPRTATDLENNIDDYKLYEVDGTIHGSGALHFHTEKIAEIAAIVVDKSYAKMGTGRKIVSYLIEIGKEKKAETIFLLTTQTTDWFIALGFEEGTINDLPKEKRESYNKKRNSKILIYTFSKDSENVLNPEV